MRVGYGAKVKLRGLIGSLRLLKFAGIVPIAEIIAIVTAQRLHIALYRLLTARRIQQIVGGSLAP